jgi:hypothetical protein
MEASAVHADPAGTVTFLHFAIGGWSTVNVAAVVVALPHELVKTARY